MSQPTHIVRPGTGADHGKVWELLEALPDFLTSLPKDTDYLRKRLRLSERSFHPDIEEPGPEQYFFVLEEVASGRLVGTAALIARVGGYEPFFTYRIENEHFAHSPLGIEKDVPLLRLEANHDGPTEIGSLFLHPESRRGGLGRLLSLSRFLFVAAFPQRFRPEVIAELRGYLDENGRSAFWDTVVASFFEREFHEADYHSGLGNKDFIRDLMPRHPIYLPLLPYAVQKVIGEVHRDTVPARKLLEREGFAWSHEVDVFDAGPLLRAETQKIRTVQACVTRKLAVIREVSPDAERYLLGNSQVAFRSCVAGVELTNDGAVLLGPETAAALRIQNGDTVQVAPLR